MKNLLLLDEYRQTAFELRVAGTGGGAFAGIFEVPSVIDRQPLRMQLHVPVAEHLNAHPYCLHIWRPHDQVIPKPPAVFVAPPWAKSA